jgi:hypothetical protein
MINNGNELIKLIDSLLTSHGFIKKKDTWYNNTKDCICFFSFGKSDLGGGQYNHVFGSFLKELHVDLDEFPKFNMNDLKYNLHEFYGKTAVTEVFNLENRAFVNDEREQLISKYMEQAAIPFLKKVSTKDGILKALKDHPDLKFFCKVRLKEHFGIPIE